MFRNRVYDQNTSRWTQEDPVGVVGGVNLYKFVGNNPVKYKDPFGLQIEAVSQFVNQFTLAHPRTASMIAGLIDQEIQGFNCAYSPTCEGPPESGSAGFLLGKMSIVAPLARMSGSVAGVEIGEGAQALTGSGRVGFPESLAGVRGTINKIFNGKAPLSALSMEQRISAAQYYERIAGQVGNRFESEARLFNLERARYLREGGEIPPGSISQFIERLKNFQ